MIDTTRIVLRYFACAIFGILLTFYLAAPALAQDDESSSDSSSHEGNSLHGRMEQIGDSLGRLARAFRKAPDPANAAQYLKWAETLHKHLIAASLLTPARAEALAGKEQTVMIAAFKKDIAATAATAQKLVEALKKDDLDQAAAFINQLKKHRNAGHEKYQEPDDE